MNKSDFAELIPFKFNDKLIISLDSRWLNYFFDDNVKFSASIKNDNLVLVGPKVSIKPTKQNTTEPTGDVSRNE